MYMAVKDKQRVNLFLDPEIVEKMRILSVKEKRSFSKLVEEAISDFKLYKDLKDLFQDK